MAIPPGAVIFGHPADDPGCNLSWVEFIPDPVVHGPGPYPCVVAWHGGGWRNGGPGSAANMLNFLKDAGFIGFSCTYRLIAQPIDGQTTDGTWPQSLTDGKVAIRAARAATRRPFCPAGARSR